MAPKVGLEPTTDRLTADCSTIELLWNKNGGAIYYPPWWGSIGFPFGFFHPFQAINPRFEVWNLFRFGNTADSCWAGTPNQDASVAPY